MHEINGDEEPEGVRRAEVTNQGSGQVEMGTNKVQYPTSG